LAASFVSRHLSGYDSPFSSISVVC
jgi:hypothetical protein